MTTPLIFKLVCTGCLVITLVALRVLAEAEYARLWYEGKYFEQPRLQPGPRRSRLYRLVIGLLLLSVPARQKVFTRKPKSYEAL